MVQSFILYTLSLLFRLLIKLFTVQIINRLNLFMPSRLLIALLKQYGATIGDNTKITPPMYFHNIDDRGDKPFQNLHVGGNCYLGPRLFLDLKDVIFIGDNVTVAMEAMLITHTDVAESPLRESVFPPTQSPIYIGDGSYLGCRVTVLEGVTIGVEAVIAAGAVVLSDVPSQAVFGGIPAKELKSVERFQDSTSN